VFRTIPSEVWAFDCEWAPDVNAGRLIYHLPDDCPADEVLRVMWREGGATEANPMPFLRMMYCRLVSIAMVIRRTAKDGTVSLFLQAIPENPDDPVQREESYILTRFLQDGVARRNPQLVGFNSRNADMRILTQRAIVNGLSLPSFAERLDAKPWESQDFDLMEMICGYGRTYGASLNDIATLSGVPGKLDTTGNDVAGLWYGEKYKNIVEYNCFDALTTYLVWLRFVYFSGGFTPEKYEEEQQRVVALIKGKLSRTDGMYLQTYLDAWQDLRKRTGQGELQ
jgi:predicted PolB exonuclease-like 3'-5' exonuclease